MATWVRLDGQPDYWTRIFDFGTGVTANMFLTPRSDAGTLRYAITAGGGGAEQRVDAAGDQRHRENNSAEERIVPAVHRVLHSVADEQQGDELGHAHLPDLSFAADAQKKKNRDVNDDGADDQVRPRNFRQPEMRHDDFSLACVETLLNFSGAAIFNPLAAAQAVAHDDRRLESLLHHDLQFVLVEKIASCPLQSFTDGARRPGHDRGRMTTPRAAN